MAAPKPPKTDPVGQQLINDAKSGTTTLARAIGQGNVLAQNLQFGGLLNLLESGGIVGLSEAEARALQGASNKYGPTAKQLDTQSQLMSSLETDRARLASGIGANGKPLTAKQKTAIEKRVAASERELTGLNQTIQSKNEFVTNYRTQFTEGKRTGADIMRERFPELQQALTDASPYLDRMGQLGTEGERLMQALGQGFQANEITSRDVGRGAVGESLYGRATQMAQSDGRLSPEAARDAVQSARQAFSARGLGTSAGSAAAELLNRDQYSRQRMFQDLGFAGQVQEADVLRQQNNANRALTASTANEEARRLGNTMNIGMLGESFTTRQQLNQQGLGASLQRSQLAGAANPYNMLLSMYSQGQPGGSQAVGPAASLASTAGTIDQSNAWNAYNANNFNYWANKYGNYGNQQSSGLGTIGNIGAGAVSGAAAMAPTGNPYLIGGGALFGGISGAFNK
jgi:hypothetical protein